MFRKILVAYDGSEGAERALDAGITLSAIHQAELWALSVEVGLPHFSATVDEVREEKEFADRHYGELLEKARSKARKAGIELKTLMRPGRASKTIVDAAGEGNFDLVLVGHTGHYAMWVKLLGTTAERVGRHAACSVLIVR
jgi:nucleotide-binding universal stress UspA family protein